MARKFKFLILNGLKKKFTSKAFIITNIILFVLIVGISNIDNIINLFGKNKSNGNEIKLHLIDNTKKYENILKKNLEFANSNNEEERKFIIEIKTDEVDKVKESIKDKDDIILLINEENDKLNVNLISNDKIDMYIYERLSGIINMSKYEVNARESNISEKDLIRLNTPASIEKVLLNKDINDKKADNVKIINILFPIFILPFYILIIKLINSIGAEINEEKSSKSMEIIISSISAKTHFYSKIVSNNIFVFAQMLLFIIYGFIGMSISNILSGKSLLSFDFLKGLSKYEFSGNLLAFIPLLILLVLGTFVTYSLITGILVSMTVNNEDLQHVSGPLIFISVIGYYLALSSGYMDGNIIIKVLGFIPLLSCFLAPGLFITGNISIISFIISILIVYLFNYVLTKYGIKIYKIGILNYSTDKMWTKLFKAVRE